METYSTSEFKPGLKVTVNGSPFEIIENFFVKPGKGQAFTRLKLKNIKNGRILEKTVKSGETLEKADVIEKEVQYLYSDDSTWYFIDTKTFDQVYIGKEIVGQNTKWLKAQDICTLILYDDCPVTLILPNFVELLVKYSETNTKKDTVQSATKSATLETGVEIQVPIFVKEGDLIKIDTRVGRYVSRIKN